MRDPYSSGPQASLFQRLMESAPVSWLARRLGTHRAEIFMLHRFADPELGVPGDDPERLHRALAALRKHRIELMSLRELVSRVRRREPLDGPTAVFTVDDGYCDFGRVAAPVFAEYDCPVTVFVSSDVIYERLWYWWDCVSYVFMRTPLKSLEVNVYGWSSTLTLGSAEGRRRTAEVVVDRLKSVTDAERRRLIDRLALEAEVTIPSKAPLEFKTLGWNEIRALESRGVEFGAHSRTHPILSREDDSRVGNEILGSWADLRAECRDPSPVFCYPNGTLDSFSAREMKLVEESGMVGAVAAYLGSVDPRTYPESLITCLPRRTIPDRPERAALAVQAAPQWGRVRYRMSRERQVVRAYARAMDVDAEHSNPASAVEPERPL